MTTEIKVPDIGDFDQVEVIEVLVSEGDTIAVEDSLITVESDKASMEIPSSAAGVINKLLVSVGDKISEGSLLLLLDAADAAPEEVPATTSDNTDTAKEAAPPQAEVSPEQKQQNTAVEKATAATTQNNHSATADEKPSPTRMIVDEGGFKRAYASPSVRRYARGLGVDLSMVVGTGRKNRIVHDDVQAFVKDALSGKGPAAISTGSGIPPIPEVDFAHFGNVREEKLNRINVLTGEHMTRCWLNVPHVTQFDEADVTDMEDFRQQLSNEMKKDGIKITPLAFIIKAVVVALKKFPRFNSSLSADGEQLVFKEYFNIGVAVDTPDGLVVPVIKNADEKSITELSEEIRSMAGAARDKKLKPSDMQGGCFTISSLGGIGGTAFTPIVNAPEVAILGVSRSKMQPVWNGSEFEPRLVMPFSVSYDHRVIDGADGARFSAFLAAMLSDVRRIMM